MYSMTTPPNMATPYAPAGTQPTPPPTVGSPNPPRLGAQVPGTTGGLPALSGLSAFSNPLDRKLQSGANRELPQRVEPQKQQNAFGDSQQAQQNNPDPNQPAQQAARGLAQYGRGEDSILVHMTPNEVNSLRGLAQRFGGDLTVNPHTGLPEAGILGKILPTLLGGLGMAFGIPPVWMGALGAVGGTIATGDLGKGLSMGLQAYGGASLAGGLGIGSKLGTVGKSLGLPGSDAIANLGSAGAQSAGDVLKSTDMRGLFGGAATGTAKTGLAGALSNFGTAAKAGLPGGIIGKAAPLLAAQGLASGVSGAMTPSTSGFKNAQGLIDNSYQGPYYSQKREFVPTPTADLLKSSKERQHLTNIMPEIYNGAGQLIRPGSGTQVGTPIMQSQLNPNAKKGENMYSFYQSPFMGAPGYPGYGGYTGYAEGGEVQIADGGFVVDARTVSEAGNGFTEKGFTDFERLGGIPLKGPGDGVSDSIPARIGDNQPARVAAGEVYMPPEAVRRIGKGDEKRGAQKLYAMMDRAHQATKRGQKRNILKGLA